jgi:hypothetical protein
MVIQNQPETVLHWMQTNAPAAWISALIAIITCIFLLRSRRKPRRIVLREVRNTSVVSIWPTVRNKIKMTFEDKPIQSLGQIEGDIFNSGSEAIQHPTLTLTLPEESVVLGVLLTPDNSEAQCKFDRNKIIIVLPYLNPVREHKQIVRLSLLTDGRTKIIDVTGGGEGWSVRHSPLPSPKQDFYRNIAMFIFMMTLVPIAWVYGGYIERRYGISRSEISLRAFISVLPLFALELPAIIYVCIYLWRSFRRSIRLLR